MSEQVNSRSRLKRIAALKGEPAPTFLPSSEGTVKSEQLAKIESLTTTDYPRELIKEIALDIGKEVAHHIEAMYPEAVKAASSTFLLSVRNCTYNEIMAALEVNEENTVIKRLAFRDKFRRHIRAAYKKIRNEANNG